MGQAIQVDVFFKVPVQVAFDVDGALNLGPIGEANFVDPVQFFYVVRHGFYFFEALAPAF